MILHSYKGMLEIEGAFWGEGDCQSPECSMVPLQHHSVISCQGEVKERKARGKGSFLHEITS